MSLINFSGLASGIDSTSLIKAILDQERAVRITPLQSKITSLTETNGAFGELKGLLLKLQEAASKFRTVNGTALEKSATSSNESIVSASANAFSGNGSYAITINSLARNGVFTQSDTFGSLDEVIDAGINDAAPEEDRTLTYTIGTGSNQETVDIVLTSSTKVSDIINEFNSESSNAVMSAVNTGTISSPSYKLVVTSLNQGTDLGAISASRGAELVSVGVFNPATATQQAAADANLDVAGVGTSIVRSSNSIADLIPGVTLYLEDTGSATVNVTDDTATTASRMQDFVDAFNDVIKYISKNDAIVQEKDGDNTKNIFGTLASTSLDENVVSALRGALSSASTNGNLVNTLADLGFSTNRDGTLSFNSQTFQDALSKDPNAVSDITSRLGETLAATGGTIAQFTQFNGLLGDASSANTDQISALNARIGIFESQLAKRQDSLVKQFSRLESLIGQLNSQQSTLGTILKG